MTRCWRRRLATERVGPRPSGARCVRNVERSCPFGTYKEAGTQKQRRGVTMGYDEAVKRWIASTSGLRLECIRDVTLDVEHAADSRTLDPHMRLRDRRPPDQRHTAPVPRDFLRLGTVVNEVLAQACWRRPGNLGIDARDMVAIAEPDLASLVEAQPSTGGFGSYPLRATSTNVQCAAHHTCAYRRTPPEPTRRPPMTCCERSRAAASIVPGEPGHRPLTDHALVAAYDSRRVRSTSDTLHEPRAV